MLDLSDFESLRESDRFEAKRAAGGVPQSVWESISAFANTEGGTVMLGAEEQEDGKLAAYGLKSPSKLIDDFWRAANSRNKLSADILRNEDVRRETVGTPRGPKDVVVIDVPAVERHLRPVYLDGDVLGKTYRRTHTGDHRCSREEVQALLRDALIDSQDGKVAERSRMDQLDQGTIGRYRNLYRQVHPNSEWADLSDEDFLMALGAADLDAEGALRPTYAGLLMFGRDRWITNEFPNYFLDYRQETGANERWEDRFTSQPGDWSGNVYDFYGKVYNKLKAALKVPFKLGADMLRVDDTPAHAALREAIANCLTNADYHGRGGVVCLWREDALTIAGPGDFTMPIEEAMKRGKSDPRNATMLKIFSFVEIGERAGSGMGTIFSGWVAGGYPEPRYEVERVPARTTLVLPLVGESDDFGLPENHQIPDANERVSDSESRTEAHRKAIAAFLARNGLSKSSEIAEAIGVKVPRTNQLLRGMMESGIVVAEGAARNRAYRLAALGE